MLVIFSRLCYSISAIACMLRIGGGGGGGRKKTGACFKDSLVDDITIFDLSSHLESFNFSV